MKAFKIGLSSLKRPYCFTRNLISSLIEKSEAITHLRRIDVIINGQRWNGQRMQVLIGQRSHICSSGQDGHVFICSEGDRFAQVTIDRFGGFDLTQVSMEYLQKLGFSFFQGLPSIVTRYGRLPQPATV